MNKISDDLFNEIKKRVPCVFNERTFAFPRAFEELQANRIDMYAFILVTPQWSQVANYVPVYSVPRFLLIQKKFFKKNLTIDDYLKNPNVKFGAVSGISFFYQSKELDKLTKDQRVVFNAFPDGVIEEMIKGKTNATFTSPAFLNRYMQQYSLKDNFEVIPDSAVRSQFALYLSKKRVSSIEDKQFREAMHDINKTGTMKRILEQYLPKQDIERYYHFE